MHKHSNYLLTRGCQLCHRAINRRRGRNDSGCVDKVTARRQQRGMNDWPLGRSMGSTQRSFSTKSEETCWDWSRQRVLVSKKQAGKERKWSKKKKRETMKLVRGHSGRESQPVPGRAAGLWHKRSWFIHLNERRAGGRAKRQWWIKTSKFRKWEKTRWKREREQRQMGCWSSGEIYV